MACLDLCHRHYLYLGNTWVLCYRPIPFGTYQGRTSKYIKSHYDNNDRWTKFSRILLQVVSNVSVSMPVTSAMCAKAVAAYCQRGTNGGQPHLTTRQSLALADKRWTDFMILISLLPFTGRRVSRPLCKAGSYPYSHLSYLIRSTSSIYLHVTGSFDGYRINNSDDD